MYNSAFTAFNIIGAEEYDLQPHMFILQLEMNKIFLEKLGLSPSVYGDKMPSFSLYTIIHKNNILSYCVR